MIKIKDELFQGIRNFKTNQRKLEYLENEIKKGMPTELKIIALQLMAEIHKEMKWYNTAAKDYCYAADLAPTFREKIDIYFKAAFMFLQSDEYFNADDNFRKVIVLASNEQKPEIQKKIHSLYFEHAENYEKEKRYTKAIKAFSKVLSLNIEKEKKLEVYDKLSRLYERIGKPRESKEMLEHKKNLNDLDNSTY